jgi:hypothetical protein
MSAENDVILKVDTALLSAMNAEREAVKGPAALLPVSGEALIALQINQLVKAGIRHFLVEVDVVSGAVVSIADQMKQRGITVEIIRSPKQLEGRVGGGELLFVMSDGIIADDALLAEMIANPSPYIVTLDGRKENERFERIDLNNFWGGLALLDRRSISAIASLPEDWSISSSLLRQALQDSVIHRPLNQELLAGKQLRRIISADEAGELTKELLARRAHDADGIVEAQIFGPLAAMAAPIFWNSGTARGILDGVTLLTTAASSGIAMIGYPVVSVCLMVAAVFLIKLTDLLYDDQVHSAGFRRLLGSGYWLLLAFAIMAVSWFAERMGTTGLFAPAVMIGLLLYAKRAMPPSWVKSLVASPALLALLLLLFAFSGGWTLGVKLMVLVQITALLLQTYWPEKNKQP